MNIEEFTQIELNKPPVVKEEPKRSSIIDLRNFKPRSCGLTSHDCVQCHTHAGSMCQYCKCPVCLTCLAWHIQYACDAQWGCWGD